LCVVCALCCASTTASTSVSLWQKLIVCSNGSSGTGILDFAAWLLGTVVQTARPVQSELPGTTVAVDQVFQVTLANDRELLLHLEFQGRRSHEPMPWRMLEYMTRLANRHRLDLESVVLYLGRGAGADDTGLYQVNGLDGTPVLAWRYRVVRLWQMRAEDLMATGQVAPLALLGQTQIAQPEVLLPAVVTRIRRVADEALRGHILSALLALLPEEEMVSMVERLLEEDEWLLELPYLRRIRAESYAEGRREGEAEGRREGEAEGRHEGEAEVVLRLLRIRFGTLPEDVTARIKAADAETLLRWSERVLSAATLEAVFTE
jgi:predicted transposase YdaD